MKKTIVLGIAALLCVAFAASAQASTLTGNLTADDYFRAYISTDDNVKGELIGEGLKDLGSDAYSWKLTHDLDPTLLNFPPSSYFLHIEAWDRYNVIAGFLGDFKLSDPANGGTEFKFANNTHSLLTNVSNNWSVRKNAWDNTELVTPTTADYGVLTSATYGYNGSTGKNGCAPWGLRSNISADATWIWTDNGNPAYSPRYFSTEITAVPGQDPSPVVPEPGSILAALSILGPAGLLFRRRK